MATRKLSSTSKYKLADAIAGTYESLVNAEEGIRRAVYASILNKAEFSVKGKKYTLATFCNEDDQLHVTRLVMRRLTQPSVQQRVTADVTL